MITRYGDYVPDICIYHKHCLDGFAAAWAVNKRWPGVEMRPCNYGELVPDQGIAGKHILIVDFSFKPKILEDMARKAASILVLDHHKTAQDDLKDLPQVTRPRCHSIVNDLTHCKDNLLVEFDMERSGARMAWDFCFPGKTPPEILLAVEDRDLWRFNRKDTGLLTTYLNSMPWSFDEWNTVIETYQSNPGYLLDKAIAVQRYRDRRVAEIVESASIRTFDGHKGVPVAFVPYAYVSNVCHELLKANASAPFSVGVVVSYDGVSCSLRSDNGRMDASEIARAHGGGGHRNAAGFRLKSLEELLCLINPSKTSSRVQGSPTAA